MRYSIVTVLAAAAVGLAALPAAAAAPVEADAEEVTVLVPTNDLDLTTPAGEAVLESRIDGAVDRVCARPTVIRDLKAMTLWEQCQSEARESAMEQLSLANPFDQFALVSVF